MPKAKPVKPQPFTTWAVYDKDDGRITYVCGYGEGRPSPGYKFQRVIHVRVTPIAKK